MQIRKKKENTVDQDPFQNQEIVKKDIQDQEIIKKTKSQGNQELMEKIENILNLTIEADQAVKNLTERGNIKKSINLMIKEKNLNQSTQQKQK